MNSPAPAPAAAETPAPTPSPIPAEPEPQAEIQAAPSPAVQTTVVEVVTQDDVKPSDTPDVSQEDRDTLECEIQAATIHPVQPYAIDKVIQFVLERKAAMPEAIAFVREKRIGRRKWEHAGVFYTRLFPQDFPKWIAKNRQRLLDLEKANAPQPKTQEQLETEEYINRLETWGLANGFDMVNDFSQAMDAFARLHGYTGQPKAVHNKTAA